MARWVAALLLAQAETLAGPDGGVQKLHASAGRAALEARLERVGALRTCVEKQRWLAQFASGKPAKPPREAYPPFETNAWPFSHCTEARRVCLHDDYLVALDEDPAAPEARDPFRHSASFQRLSWFADQQVIFNTPGFIDSADGVQHKAAPVRARHVTAMETEDLLGAPLLNATPVLVYPLFPFNFGDTLYPYFTVPWAHFEERHAVMRDAPLLVAVPEDLRLPDFWRLPETPTRQVASFHAASADCDGAGPVCFERVIGCKADYAGSMEWAGNATYRDAAEWERVRQRLVAQWCPQTALLDHGAAQQDDDGPRTTVVFAARRGSRQIRNLGALLAACDGAPGPRGGRLACTSRHFDDALQDICAVQSADVLVGLHGADLVNAMFMRPGASLIEVRSDGWWDRTAAPRSPGPDSSWMNAVRQKLLLTNATRYWFYGAEAAETFRPETTATTLARDSDVEVSWPVLECQLAKALSVGSRAEYEALGAYGYFPDCQKLRVAPR